MSPKQRAEKRALQQQAFIRENGRCFYCEKEVFSRQGRSRYAVDRHDDATIDHIVPQSEGGQNDLGNIVLACRRCNGKRGTSPADHFLLKANKTIRRELAAQIPNPKTEQPSTS
jgi:5-methylcytosine-specific restriction endonuclease McrA